MILKIIRLVFLEGFLFNISLVYWDLSLDRNHTTHTFPSLIHLSGVDHVILWLKYKILIFFTVF